LRSCITLSKTRDADLIALYNKVGNKEFQKMIKESLRMILRGGIVQNKKHDNIGILIAKDQERDVRLNFILTAQKDEDIRLLLSQISNRKVGTFVKAALRFYIGPAAVLSGFLKPEFAEKLSNVATPVQVMAFGNISETESIRKTYRKRNINRKKITKTQPIPYEKVQTEKLQEALLEDSSKELSSPEFEKHIEKEPSVFPKMPEYQKVPEIQPDFSETFEENSSDEDELLAMLSGILG